MAKYAGARSGGPRYVGANPLGRYVGAANQPRMAIEDAAGAERDSFAVGEDLFFAPRGFHFGSFAGEALNLEQADGTILTVSITPRGRTRVARSALSDVATSVTARLGGLLLATISIKQDPVGPPADGVIRTIDQWSAFAEAAYLEDKSAVVTPPEMAMSEIAQSVGPKEELLDFRAEAAAGRLPSGWTWYPDTDTVVIAAGTRCPNSYYFENVLAYLATLPYEFDNCHWHQTRKLNTNIGFAVFAPSDASAPEDGGSITLRNCRYSRRSGMPEGVGAVAVSSHPGPVVYDRCRFEDLPGDAGKYHAMVRWKDSYIHHRAFNGVPRWDSDRTYQAGEYVLHPTIDFCFRVLREVRGIEPPSTKAHTEDYLHLDPHGEPLQGTGHNHRVDRAGEIGIFGCVVDLSEHESANQYFWLQNPIGFVTHRFFLNYCKRDEGQKGGKGIFALDDPNGDGSAFPGISAEGNWVTYSPQARVGSGNIGGLLRRNRYIQTGETTFESNNFPQQSWYTNSAFEGEVVSLANGKAHVAFKRTPICDLEGVQVIDPKTIEVDLAILTHLPAGSVSDGVYTNAVAIDLQPAGWSDNADGVPEYSGIVRPPDETTHPNIFAPEVS